MLLLLLLVVVFLGAGGDGAHIRVAEPATSVSAGPTCGSCLAFMNASSSQVLNIIYNIGVVGTCTELCSYLPAKSQATQCTELCEFAGISHFVTVFTNSFNGGPVCLCDNLKGESTSTALCPSGPSGALTFQDLKVVPEKGAPGAVFEFIQNWRVTKKTATGLFNVTITPPGDSSIPLSKLMYFPPQADGSFSLDVNIATEKTWTRGKYGVEVKFCEGGCVGSFSCKGIMAAELASGHSEFTLS